MRFNVEADGHVRNAEAVSAIDTDLGIAACAKRVLSEWVFAKHPGEADRRRAHLSLAMSSSADVDPEDGATASLFWVCGSWDGRAPRQRASLPLHGWR